MLVGRFPSVEAQPTTYLLTTEMSNSSREGRYWDKKFSGRSENSEVKREQVGYHGKCLSRCLFLQVWFMTEASASSGPSTGWASPELTVSPGSILKCRLSGPNTSAELESAFNRVIHMHTKG